MTTKALNCDDIKKSIIETFWILSEEDLKKYPERKEFF